MDTYDISYKLAYAGRRSPVPFITGPEFTNSVPGIPVLAALRIFIPAEYWAKENVVKAAREICRVLGASAQFDIGITTAGSATYEAAHAAAGNVARLTKLDPTAKTAELRIQADEGDELYVARFPSLRFERTGDDYWRSSYATGAVKPAAEQ